MKPASQSTLETDPAFVKNGVHSWLMRALLIASLVGAGCQEEPASIPAGSGTPSAPSLSARAAPMNVVIITMDTVRADALGAYGQALPTTPFIDRMAAEGVLFEQCVTSAPNTLPSHATIFTGKQPYAHGVRSNGGYVLAQGNVTLAEVLRGRATQPVPRLPLQ